jgi:hypothetical protein
MSAFTEKNTKIFDKSTFPTITSDAELRRALAFQAHHSISNPAYKGDDEVAGKLQALFSKTNEKGEPLTSVQLAQHANAIILQDKNTKQSLLNGKILDKAIVDTIEKVETGEGSITRMFNATASIGSATAVKDYLVTNGMQNDPEDTIQNLEWADYGTSTPTLIGGKMDNRIPVPIGVSKNVFLDAVDNVRLKYNKKYSTKFDKGDVSFRTTYDKRSNNFITEMFNSKNANERIGIIDSESVYILANKTEAKKSKRKTNR